ncbi:ABC transporter substrate-binding protein [bacterium]|nr:ABC transporter substrate-binding protein [bacterium]
MIKIFILPLIFCSLAAYIIYHQFLQTPVFTIGIAQWVSNPEFEKNILGFKKGLASKGFIEGKNLHFLIKNPKANKDVQHEIIQKFISHPVDLIYSLTTPGTLISSQKTQRIPIVFSIVTYPQEAGLIQSLKNSNNNLTGTRNHVSFAKQFYFFESLFPKLKKVAFAHRLGEPNSKIQFKELSILLKSRGITLIDIAASSLEDLKKQLNSSAKDIDAIYSACDTLIQSGGEEIVIQYSLQHLMPNFTCNKDGIAKGALIGNVADFETIGRASGIKAAQILNGALPQWIETESMSIDYLSINLKTAKVLNLEIPKSLIAQSKYIVQ